MQTASSFPLHLDLKNLKSPNISSATARKVKAKYKEWIASDYAGFRRILDENSAEAPNLTQIQNTVREFNIGITGKAIENFVILGTGGSSLGAEALITGLRPFHVKPHFYFMDNNDPAWFSEHLEHWDPETTLFYAVSKSGGTAETWSQLLVAIAWLQKGLKQKESWKRHCVFCTDPASGDFRVFAQKNQVTCLEVPSAVGGRFSVFTPVGLFPTAFAGIDNEAILRGARCLVDTWEELPLEENPVFHIAHALYSEPKHQITVSFAYSSHLRAFGRWFNQLWGESLGKAERGYTPYSAIGTTDQHSQTQLYMEGPRDKIFAFHHIEKFPEILPIPTFAGVHGLKATEMLTGKTMRDLFEAEFKATRDALTEAGLPNFTVSLPTVDAASMGALLYFWEWLTVYMGALLEIDPFTQPGVEKGKVLTKKYLQNP